MEKVKRTKVVDLLKSTAYDSIVNVKGWVRTHRSSKAVDFIALNDGSTINNIQIVVDPSKVDENQLRQITTGACISAVGTLVESQGAGQSVEIQCESIEIYGLCGNDYPMQKKGQSFEYMRQYAHLRLRTNTFGAVMRIRHNMAMAIHTYFHEHGYFYFNTPLITASDCEGAGQMFQVTTKNLYNLKKTEDGKIDYSDDFFGKQTSLTVSGQLEGELGATALGAIYTFGPTFRAENSNTPRHLAEFWMVEPEVAFLDMAGLMELEEDFIKYCIRWALDNCKDDLAFLNKMIDKGLIARLEGVLNSDFVHLPYTEGIRILQEAIANGKKFEFPCEWGDDLASEHERFLVEEHFKRPVIMTNYPKAIKAFYMKIDDEESGFGGKSGKTVQGTEGDFQKLKQAAIDFSSQNVTSADQILEIQAIGGELGIAVENLETFSTVVSNLDIATDLDTESAAEGLGPVDALDKAMRRALTVFYPSIAQMRLTDFKVRVLDSSMATASQVRVLVESTDGVSFWSTHVPTGEDQEPMLEQTREIVRKFNDIYGEVLVEPDIVLSTNKACLRLPGTDGKAKMSKSIGNCIYLADSPKDIETKIMSMFTDPTHLRRDDPGHVEGNPVFTYLDAFSSDEHFAAFCPEYSCLQEMKDHYTRGGLGDVKVKRFLNQVMQETLRPIRERREYWEAHLEDVQDILKAGCEKAENTAAKTLAEVRRAMRINYFEDGNLLK